MILGWVEGSGVVRGVDGDSGVGSVAAGESVSEEELIKILTIELVNVFYQNDQLMSMPRLYKIVRIL